jgi:hypothetical protein
MHRVWIDSIKKGFVFHRSLEEYFLKTLPEYFTISDINNHIKEFHGQLQRVVTCQMEGDVHIYITKWTRSAHIITKLTKALLCLDEKEEFTEEDIDDILNAAVKLLDFFKNSVERTIN